MSNQDLLLKFYHSFSLGKAEDMISCYHDDIEFEDPAFGKLKGERAKNMWRMLLSNKDADLRVEYNNIKANDSNGKVSWKADYFYGQFKRPITNHVEATFEFKDGKIIKHKDDFDLWNWTMQSLGMIGYVLGWSSYMKNKINTKTSRLLTEYMDKKGK